MDIDEIISGGGMTFRKGSSGGDKKEDKVKTKAKKKKYITGAHGSGSAKQKAKYREQRANRHKKRSRLAKRRLGLSGVLEDSAFLLVFVYLTFYAFLETQDGWLAKKIDRVLAAKHDGVYPTCAMP